MHESIRRMAMAGLALRKPDGQQLSMGDSDDMNTKSIYALAAYVYEDPVFRWAGGTSPGYDNTYLVVAAHTEMTAPVTLYQIEDRMACGNVIVFDLDCCKYEGIVLNW